MMITVHYVVSDRHAEAAPLTPVSFCSVLIGSISGAMLSPESAVKRVVCCRRAEADDPDPMSVCSV